MYTLIGAGLSVGQGVLFLWHCYLLLQVLALDGLINKCSADAQSLHHLSHMMNAIAWFANMQQLKIWCNVYHALSPSPWPAWV